ncbi:hypothetical protein IJJ53_04140 [Candidatus Saccharibacteria bacterium]|nr:hypothetical protein [Candidatus Saccharibacteria bacterium]
MGKSNTNNKSDKTGSYTEFYYHFFRNTLIVSLPLLIISALVLSSFHSSAAELSQADDLAISIPTSCTLSSFINDKHSKSILNGTYESGIGQTILTTYCNDKNGYVVYASGFSNNELGNNKLISNINDNINNYDIVSGTATSGTTSNWAMKLSTSDIDSSIINTNAGTDTPTIEPAYNNQYAVVPTNWTKVASKSSGTVASATGSSFTTTYAVYASTTQPAGTYNGQVRYLLAHPYVSPTILYMQDVATWKDSLNTHDTVLAVDRRDYKAYWVTKLLDGHIWMTQNLAIDLSTGENEDKTPIMRTFTSEDTDLNTIYNETTGNYTEYNNGYEYDFTNDIISWTPADSATTIKFKGTAVLDWSTNSTNNTPASATKTDGLDTGHESLGNYYNWTAAIASNDSSALTTSTYNNVADNPQNSICPKGWRLPTISSQSNTALDSTNEFARLNYIYNNNQTTNGAQWFINPIWYTKAGSILPVSGGVTRYLEYGIYQSSTISGNDDAYNSFISSVLVAPTNNYYDKGRKNGRSIRCVTR